MPRASGIAVAALAALLSSCGTEAASPDRPARSDSVKVDQVGYLPLRPKLAVVTDTRAAGSFSVRRARDGAEVLTGSLGPARSDPDTVFGAGLPRSRGSTVMASYSLRRADGSLVREGPPTPIVAAENGRLVRTLGLSLDGLPEGAYELQMRVENGPGGPAIEAREPFVLARGDGT